MNWNIPSTVGDWMVIVGAILVTHGLFVLGAHAGWWGTDDRGHIHLK